MRLLERLQFWAKETPEAAAVACGVTVVHTYQSLAHRAASLAAGFQAMGLRSSDRVALFMENRSEFFECVLACWQSSLTVVPINSKLHPREVEWILSHSNCRLLIVSPKLVNACFEQWHGECLEVGSVEYHRLASHPGQPGEAAPESVAWLFYTSGTTGRPKGAMISHRNLEHMIEAYFSSIDVREPHASILHPAPLSHGSGLYALAHLWIGSTQVVPESGGFDCSEVFSLSEKWPGSVFFAAPTMLNRLVNSPDSSEFRQLKCAIAGGAPLYLNDLSQWYQRFGSRLCQLYGQGESPMTISGWSQEEFSDRRNPTWEIRMTSVGRAQHGVDLKVVDNSGEAVASGQIGEVICRSACVVAGYWNDRNATRQAIRDGWLWTGDMGKIDENGYLTLSDRSKDVIISGGSNVYPREIEEVLLTHPWVEEASVVGVPDSNWGESVLAFVVPTSEFSADKLSSESQRVQLQQELDAHCLLSIARFKRPRQYKFVARLPKNNYGKVLKTELRKEARDAQAGRLDIK